jgi:hypothetical protein
MPPEPTAMVDWMMWLALVVVQQAPQRRDAGERQRGEGRQDLPADAGKEDHVKPHGEHEQRGAEVGLARDDRHRQGEQQAREREIAQPERRLVAVEIPRQHERHRDLHHLRWLHAHESEVQPAAGAVHHVPEQRHGDQQREPEQVGRQRKTRQRLRRHLRGDPHRHERDGKIEQLSVKARRRVVARRIKRCEADAGEGEHDREQRAVEAACQSRQRAARRHRGKRHQSPACDGSVSLTPLRGGTLPRR